MDRHFCKGKDKTKSGEYVLSRPPKNHGRIKEADDMVTALTVAITTALTMEIGNAGAAEKVVDVEIP